jgi:hypothetical protein
LVTSAAFAYFLVEFAHRGWIISLTLSALVGVLLAGLLTVLSIRTHRPYCKACKKYVPIIENMIGLPVSGEVLVDPSNAEVIKKLASDDYSPLETAEPYASNEEWITRPAIQISLGRCDNCDGPFIMLVVLHGMDEARNIMAPPGGLHVDLREVDKASGTKLIKLARQRGLIPHVQLAPDWVYRLVGERTDDIMPGS